MKQLKVTVTTQSPIVLTTESNSTVMTGTHDAISGSILRGVLAAQYIDARGLGKQAHQSEEFRRLFFGALRFTDANIACTDSHKRSFVIPLSMQKEKAKAGQTEAVEDLMRVEKPQKGMKSFRGYAVLTGDGLVKNVSAPKDVSLHISRTSEEERKKGRSEDGGVYNYESIDAGQTFVGFVIGEDADIASLRAHIPNVFPSRIGRSKYTQYGQCEIKLDTSAETVERISGSDLENERTMILRFDSPFVFDDPKLDKDGKCVMATAKNALDAVADAMNGPEGKVFRIDKEKIFAADAEIENYVGVWGMKRPRERALAAGTVFALVKDEPWTAEDFEKLENLMYGGVGRRTEEGFGQIRHWPRANGKWKKPETNADQAPVSLSFEKASEEVAKIAKRTLARRIAEQMRIYAAEDVKKAQYKHNADSLSGLTHFFSRLDHLLDAEQNARGGDGRKQDKTAGLRESYRQTLKNTVRPKSSMDNNLKDTSVNGISLYDMLMGESELPVYRRRWLEDVGTKKDQTKAFMHAVGLEENMFDVTDGQYFYEYWHSFFYYARKRAVTKQEEVGSDA